jgi:hypothetical protein
MVTPPGVTIFIYGGKCRDTGRDIEGKKPWQNNFTRLTN